MKQHRRERLLASTIICGALLGGAAPAFGQDAGAQVEEVVVTGTRIPQPNLESVSPVQTVGAEEIQQGGRPVTADILNQLPQVFQNSVAGFSSTSNPLSNPGGIATVDLRGLGQQRTLVLVDGRRLGIGDPNTGNPNPSPDINQIPSQLIERVEVLTGGASATYGSDAVAGVVNFVMKRNFEGVQMDAQWGVYQHTQHNEFMQGLQRSRGIANPKEKVWDGKSRDLSLVAGLNAPDGRGNVTAYVTYHDQDPVTQAQRDYSACQLNVTAAGAASCAGSSNSNLFYRADGSGGTYAVVGNSFVPYSQTANTSPPALFNSNDYAYLLQQSTRWTAGFFANYEVNDHFKLYSDFSFMDDRSQVQTAPSGLFQGTGSTVNGGFLVNCNNPLLSAQQRGAIGCTAAQIAAGESVELYIGRRNIEGGGRNQFYNHTNYRAVLGTRGNIAGSWNYDLYGSYYYTSLYQESQGYFSVAAIQNALQVVQTPNGPRCISGGACVPYNIFQQGGVTNEALEYLTISGMSRGSIAERIVEGSINGDLGDYGVKSPWANDGVGVAFGFQFRRDHLDYRPDQAQLNNDLSGGGGASTPIDNSISVREGFGEARVPLVQDAPFAKNLQLELGYRYSDYSTGINAKTWKVGTQWAVNDDIRFRGSIQQAIRAPSIIELYSPQAVTNTSQVSVDPCSPTLSPTGQIIPATATLAQCQRTGVTAAQYGNGGSTNIIPQCPSGQCASLLGGNPDLGAERAKTYSLGVSLTPGWLRGFSASVDYYKINLEGTIGNVGLGVVLSRCLETGDAKYCSQVRRSANGSLFGTTVGGGGYINGLPINIGAGSTSGVDIQANYRMPLDFGRDWGTLSFSLAGAYLLENSTKPEPTDASYDCAGLFGAQCQVLSPRWRHTFRVTWDSPWDVQLSAAWRYIHEMTYERDTDEPSIGFNERNAFNHKLPQRSYLDLSANWQVNEKTSLRAGVNNVLDQDPPLVNSRIVGTGLPNAYPSYDLLGRRLFVGFTAGF